MLGGSMAERFERYTPRAQRALTLAWEEAQRYGRPYIGAEHLLLGVLDERDSTGAQVLRRFNIDAGRVRGAVEMLTRHHSVGDGGIQPALSQRARRVLELAADEAHLHQHGRIGTGHLLLGLVREDEGIPAGVLASMGVSTYNLDRVREQVVAVDRPPLL